jgi:hypothetical protein
MHPQKQQLDLLQVIADQSKTGNVEALQKLIDLKIQVDRYLAQQAYREAKAAALAEIGVIAPNRTARIKSRRTGDAYQYTYASLDHLIAVAGPVLTKHGFSWSWEHRATEQGVETTCRLVHRDGHSETATFTCPLESGDYMSARALHVSARTTGCRITFLAVTGIAVAGEDTDRTVVGSEYRYEEDPFSDLPRQQQQQSQPNEPPATEAQIKLLQTLCQQKGVEYIEPPSKAIASSMITRLKALPNVEPKQAKNVEPKQEELL